MISIIVIEGPDGSGKTTQIELLQWHYDKLGVPVNIFRSLGGTEIGWHLRTLLMSRSIKMAPMTRLMMFCASFAQIVFEVKRIAETYAESEKPRLVILDRWTASTYAYQGLTLPLTTVQKAVQIATENFQVDALVYLKIDAETAFKRLTLRSQDALDEVAKRNMNQIIDLYNSYLTEPRATIVDATRSKEDVFADVLQIVERLTHPD